jgi:hypothetical protein
MFIAPDYSNTFSYKLKVTYPTNKVVFDKNLESNDTMEAAFPLVSRAVYNQYIDSPLDFDWYSFKGYAGKKVKVMLTNLPFDYELYVYDRYGTRLFSSTNGGTSSELIEFTVPETATYYILVSPSGGGYSLAKPYRLTAIFGTIAAPKVNKVTTNSTYVTGKAEKGLKVYVKQGKQTIGSGTVSSNGTFSVKIPKQKRKSKLFVYLRDEAGNNSPGVTISVQ